MATLIDKAGNRYDYTTIAEHEDSVTLDGDRIIQGKLPDFTIEEAILPLLTPMTLYLAFKPAERIAIKTSADPLVVEFWAMYQLSVQLDKPTDPNLKSVKEALAYLAQPKAATPPGAGILESADRIEEIRRGIAQ